MFLAGTMLLQCQQVLRGSVPLMGVKPIVRVLLMQLHAPLIAVHLGQNRCRLDAWHQCITAHDCFGQDIDHRQAIAVDQHLDRSQAQAQNRTAHRQHGGLKDIEFVDLLHRSLGNGAAQSVGQDALVQALALRSAEFF